MRAVDSTHVLSVSAHLTIREAISTLNLMERFCSAPRLLVAEPGASLFAPVSDLDLRMALLGGCSPDCPLSQLPAQPGARPESARSLEQPGERFDPSSTLAVVMAGGEGRRVRPFTARMPKPMLPVQGQPVLAILLRSLRAVGLRRVAIVIRYRHREITEYFGHGRIAGLEITFVREPFPLGTAGALGTLPLSLRSSATLLVINADILTTVSFRSLLRFHAYAGLPATVCVRPLPVSIPFGVPICKSGRLIGFEEKPVKIFHVNSGIYCLPAAAIEEVPPQSYLDMPTLIERLLAGGMGIGTFPLVDAYHEIGTVESYRKAPAFYELHRSTFEGATAG